MRLQEFELLEEVGLTGYERKALVTLMVHGVADAETLCRKGEVPSSKIYQAMEKLGVTYQTAPQLVAFLRKHRAHLEQVTGIRYSGEMGHPFHVVDDDTIILSLDHPFIPEGRFASLLVREKDLAQKLADGFESLWTRAMCDLREIDFQPGHPPAQA